MESSFQPHKWGRMESDGGSKRSLLDHNSTNVVAVAEDAHVQSHYPFVVISDVETEESSRSQQSASEKARKMSDSFAYSTGKHFHIGSSRVSTEEGTDYRLPSTELSTELSVEEVGLKVAHVISRRTHSQVLLRGSRYAVTHNLLTIQVEEELQGKNFHIFYSSAVELNYQSNMQNNSVMKFLTEKHISEWAGDKVVILIDHYSKDSVILHSVLDQLLKKKLLPNCVIILGLCDESSYDDDSAIRFNITARTAEEDCADLLDLLKAPPDILRFILQNCIDICSSVELVRMVLEIFQDRAPSSLATMLEALVLKKMNSEASLLSTLHNRWRNKFISLCKLAYLNLNDTEGIDYEDVSKCVTLDELNGAFSNMKNAGMGLLMCPQSAEETGIGKCFFVHDLIKQFMVACYIANEPLLCQIRIFKQTDIMLDSKHSKLSMLYFMMNNIWSTANKHSKTELPYVYSCLLMGLNFTSEKVDYIYELLYHSQNPELVQKLFSKRTNELTLKLSGTNILDSLAPAIKYVISNSGISEWVISTHEGLRLTANFISLSVKSMSSGRVKVKTIIIEEETFIVQPAISKSNNNGKSIVSDCTYVKCLREILHRILQLFSPVKIKSSSSESSYVSFLACNCLKKKLEETQLLHFEPIQAFHWLKSNLSKQSLKRRNSKNSKEALEFEEHMASYHNMEQAELVIMVAPLPERIYYLEPHSSIKRCIELYRNKPELNYKKPIIERSDGTFVTFKECFDDTITQQLTKAVQDERPENSAMVAPLLPIPKSNISTSHDHRTTTHIDQPIHNVISKGVQSSVKPLGTDPGESGFYSDYKKRYGMMTASETQPLAKPQELARVEKYGGNFVAMETSLLQENSRSRAQVQRQVAVEPGTVLYSTMPNVFAVDAIYPCPDENRLIKKGGNGAIYSATYGRYEFAVKKTPYRSREIEVHKLLKHPNVVELKCLMFGQQQPEFKRRYFSYHFMSKYNGDLSRLVTNKPELTMVNLSEQYKGNPRLLGSIQGNWKFILKEVLKGLAYMHSHGVIHRDIKASNILIKLFCDCDNLLTCTCSVKYSVCIADFDAAVILDSNNGIPPTSVPNHQRLSPNQKQVYQVIPVGTDGYRAPESAQMIVSNDLSILDPPLTVKADIWSVGLILIRMLNGATGPTRQQKLSTLLLYYHQTKKGGRRKHYGYQYHPGPQFPLIQKSEIDTIIGLTKFNDVGNSWMKKAVDCIAKCVEIDPDRRPTAESLLRDSFLY